MALVNWDPSYSVKVTRCDEDHKQLFALINTLHEAMVAGKGTEVARQVVKELLDYTRYHFTAEEALLEKTKYPALPFHRVQHQAFIKKVQQFQEDVAAGSVGQSIQVVNFLKNWLVSHIKEVDQKYAAHLNANGIS